MEQDLTKEFINSINLGYETSDGSLFIGAGQLNGTVFSEAAVSIPLKTLNRHGLIAGATGTGKTKSVQVLAERLSVAGVPSLLMDIKGDLSGLAMPSPGHPKIDERQQKIGEEFISSGFPVELLSLSDEPGIRLRATVAEFGPVLLSKVLGLNDTQESVLTLVFEFCDDQGLLLVDLEDIKTVLRYIQEDGKEVIEKHYGRVSGATTGAIFRKIIALEHQGADTFFGEPSFDPEDLLRKDDTGRGIISILRLTDIQDRPALFSTFMLSLLAEIYQTFPEIGDPDKPKLALFIDEAHLVFNNASKTLLDQLEQTVKLIRSKGIGVFFVTQNPDDVPAPILSQLGLRIQHALRAVTARDRKAIKQAAENFPLSDFYTVDRAITSLGIGEALITALNAKGKPTPLVSTFLVAPKSRMDILTAEEIKDLVRFSDLVREYQEPEDRDSAYEILTKKMEAAAQRQETERPPSGSRRQTKPEPTLIEELSKNTMVRQMGRTLVRELSRGLLGVLGASTGSRRRK